MGEEARDWMADESTTQILTIIRDDVKEIRGDVKSQGHQIARIERTQEVQQENLSTLRFEVDQVMKAHLDCPTPKEVQDLKKRISDVKELSKRDSAWRTPADGVKIFIQTGGIWKKLLPFLILAAIGGTGWATDFFGLLGK